MTFYNRGFALAAKGEFDRAVEDYDRAIGLNSTFSQAFLNRGFAHAARETFDRAIVDYDQAIQLNPNVAIAFYNRGVARARKGAVMAGAVERFCLVAIFHRAPEMRAGCIKGDDFRIAFAQ